ncbi:MAG: hypothetical protein GWN47_10785 [Woeseiaceae bacterium]|nr:hypothetical protein [Woeseiaceae bacterium]
MRGISRLLPAIALAFVLSGTAAAQNLQSVETDSLRLLYFDPTTTYLVPRVIQTFHDSLDRQKSILGFEPTEKTTVLLLDFSDYGNGGAISVPSNAVTVDIAPIALTFETSAAAERMYKLMNHELVHITALDKTGPRDRGYRKFFGGKVMATDEHPESMLYQYLTSPRFSAPRWFHEGIAVFQETWMNGGLGRSQGGYNEMVFRAMVRDDAHFYDPLGLVAEGVKVDFQVGANAYLYGERFMSYLAYTYSPEQLTQWVVRTEGGHRNYKNAFDEVFGISLDDAWQGWIDLEHEFQEKNLATVRQFPITPHEDLTEGGLGSVSRTFYDSERNSLISAVRFPGKLAHIAEYSLDGRELEHLTDIKKPMLYRVTSLAYDDASETVFYTADNYAWRDLMAYDLKTGKRRELMKNQRIGEIVFNKSDRSIWGVRHLNGYATLVRIPHPYDQWQQIQTLPYGEIAYDLDISPDGTLLSGSFGDVQGNQTLKVFRIDQLQAGEFEPVQSFEFGQAVPESFVFSPDGQYLFGSSYFTGVSNIFRYELASGDLEAVSNTETGFFRPIPIDNEDLIVFRYTGQGFLPTRIEAEPLEDVAPINFFGTEVIRKHPVLQSWQAGTDDSPPAESRIVARGEYEPVRSMSFESIYPMLLGYKDSESVGLKANWSDPLQFNKLSIGAAYSVDSELPSDERLNLAFDYRHTAIRDTPFAGNWHFGARLNYADFYDLFGPTKSSRKGERYFIGYKKTLMSDDPRSLSLSAQINHYRDMDALPRYQNVGVLFDKLSSFYANLSYRNVRRSLGAVDDEKGYLWNLGTAVNYIEGETIPKYYGNFDFGFALPWGHSSLWVRTAAGYADGDADDPFANFYFGGFGNNYVDRGAVKRYRENYAMPGFELNAIPGRTAARSMLELNLPPIRFDRVGTPKFYLSWARPALFASVLFTNFDDQLLEYRSESYGIQIDFHFTLMSRFDMTLSTGYAKGYGDGDITDDEFMISLKIM